ncbi:MAG TPA: right-handed parallel beta-helix repeat-containing protein [Polyangiaceae bacterium]|nr:right-handed parallel beta-helix repeat-containing protein [Polyangiaceae bacterium]
MAHPLSVASRTLVAGLLATLPVHAATLTVGPGKTYAKPCAAIAAASDGDTIEIDAAGTYDGDVCAVPKNRLTLRGVAGRPKIDAASQNYGGKGIWVISGSDTIVENIEFSGATVPDQNGAGIRQEGSNLTVRGCYFHDNENGILSGGGPTTEIIVEYSEFANNGFGDGFSHNMYIGHEGRFTLRYSYSHSAKVGHLVKSRAAENYILYNRLSGEDGTSSYELDLPNAGTSYVIGNIIEQGAATQNSGIVTYGLEGTTAENPGHALFVVNNTFVNDRTAGSTFISIGAAITTPVVVTNNIFFGGGTITNQANAMQQTNFAQGDPKLVDRAAYDYRLAAGSPCINAGSDPGVGAGFALSPARQYVHPANAIDRNADGTLDIGAYEFGVPSDGGVEAGTDASDASAPPVRDASDAATPPAPDASDGGAPRPPDASDAAAPRDVSDAATARDASDSAAMSDARETGASDSRDASDAGQPAPPDAADGGTSPPPGSTGDASSDGGGCGCRTAHGRDGSGFVAACAALMLAVRRRRVRHGARLAARARAAHRP